jgi:hypothetical protein
MNPEIAILEQWFKLLNDRIHTLMGENGNLEDQVQDLTRQLQQVTLKEVADIGEPGAYEQDRSQGWGIKLGKSLGMPYRSPPNLQKTQSCGQQTDSSTRLQRPMQRSRRINWLTGARKIFEAVISTCQGCKRVNYHTEYHSS